MDILIKGMELPKCCANCPLRVDGFHTFQCMRLLGRAYTYDLAEQRQEDCPLVALPEHHGELIDRNALIERIGDNIPEINTPKEYLAVSRLLAEIGTAPTIVEASE